MLIADLDHVKYKIPNGWVYRAMLPTWTCALIGFQGWPNWDIVANTGSPPFVMVTLIYAPENRRDRPQSYKLAQLMDDRSSGLFCYRDWTRNGSNNILFCNEHGGIASWKPNYDNALAYLRQMRQEGVVWH